VRPIVASGDLVTIGVALVVLVWIGRRTCAFPAPRQGSDGGAAAVGSEDRASDVAGPG
jgi:hypothetical protein